MSFTKYYLVHYKSKDSTDTQQRTIPGENLPHAVANFIQDFNDDVNNKTITIESVVKVELTHLEDFVGNKFIISKGN